MTNLCNCGQEVLLLDAKPIKAVIDVTERMHTKNKCDDPKTLHSPGCWQWHPGCAVTLINKVIEGIKPTYGDNDGEDVINRVNAILREKNDDFMP